MSEKSKYLGQGIAGCVIKPGLDCKYEPIPNSISKLFARINYYQEELVICDKIKEIDPEHTFTVEKKNNCELKRSDIMQRVEDINQCQIFYSKTIYQIVYEYGGMNLYKLFINNNILDFKQEFGKDFEISSFLEKMLDVFKGIKLLVDKGYFHSDIKLDNIVYNGEKIFLIDFGEMKKADEYYNENVAKLITTTPQEISHYPSEILLHMYLYLNKDYDLSKVLYINNFISNMTDHIHYHNNRFSQVPEYYKELMTLNDYLTETSSNYKNLFNKTYFNNEDLFNMDKIRMETSKKFDVYQMGLVLYQIILNTIINNSSEVKKIPIHIFKLLRGMLEPNPFERYSITDVIKKYSSIFQLGSVTSTKEYNDKISEKAKRDTNIQIITDVMDVYNWDNKKILYELAKLHLYVMTKEGESFSRKKLNIHYLYRYIDLIDKIITKEQHSDILEKLVRNNYGYSEASSIQLDFEGLKNLYAKEITKHILKSLFDIEFDPYLNPDFEYLKGLFTQKMNEMIAKDKTKGGNKLKSMIKADIIKILLNKYPNMKNLKSMSKNELMKLLKKKKLSKT